VALPIREGTSPRMVQGRKPRWLIETMLSGLQTLRESAIEAALRTLRHFFEKYLHMDNLTLTNSGRASTGLRTE